MAITKGRTSTASATSTVKVGDRAPELVLPTSSGETWRLADAKGHNVVVAFFPFAFTPV